MFLFYSRLICVSLWNSIWRMMPRCIAPGCSSGTSILKTEKIHFFMITKDEEQRKLWRLALRRREAFKPSQRLCHKHFKKDDILWRQQLLDPNGSVVGESAMYQRPRLKQGAVPSIFFWNERPRAIVNLTKSTPVKPDIDDGILDRNSLSLIFKDILKSQMRLPKSWIRRLVTGKGFKFVSFLSVKRILINGVIETTTPKEVIVTPDMKIRLRVLDRNADVLRFGISDVVTGMEMLQDALFMINSLNICAGIGFRDVLPNTDGKVTYVDKKNTVRHRSCPMLDPSKLCKFCDQQSKKELGLKAKETGL